MDMALYWEIITHIIKLIPVVRRYDAAKCSHSYMSVTTNDDPIISVSSLLAERAAAHCVVFSCFSLSASRFKVFMKYSDSGCDA